MIAAIVPAAGRSTRMGRPKLTLPVAGEPLIARVVAAFLRGGTGRVVVVAPPTGEPGAAELVATATARGAGVVIPAAPPADMRASVELGLVHLARGTPPSAVLLAPGDSPGLHPALVARVIRASAGAPGRIILPRHEGRRGHPVLIPWALAGEVARLPPGLGVNALLAGHPFEIESLDLDDPAILADLDTPEDYRRWPG